MEELTPRDARSIRQLAQEVRLCIETARQAAHRAAPFIDDARRHLQLLRALVDTLPERERLASLVALTWRAWLAMLPAGDRRHRWHHRAAFLGDATRLLFEFQRGARALERELWVEP